MRRRRRDATPLLLSRDELVERILASLGRYKGAVDERNLVRHAQVHHGMVLVSDGRGRGRPCRLELTRDTLAVQLAAAAAAAGPFDDAADALELVGLRTVTIKKQKDGGLGLAVKGGSDTGGDVPVLISKIIKGQAAEKTRQLYVGDAIVEVNGASTVGKTHEEVVDLLREAGNEVRLSVRHHSQMASVLQRAASDPFGRTGLVSEPHSDTATWKSSLKAQSDAAFSERASVTSGASSSADDAPDGFRTVARLPLPMAYVTRYLWGTDKIRPNAFEVRAVDGSSTGIVHCDDSKALDQWLRHIHNNIGHLNNKSIKMSNKYLHSSEHILYLGWVCEMEPEKDGVEGGELKQRWEPRFLILKGSDLCLFESPPLNADDLAHCVCSYKVYETLYRQLNEAELKDGRDCVFRLETAGLGSHYLAVETRPLLAAFETAWHRAVYQAVYRLQTRTFACNYAGRPSGLLIDIRQGFGLYDVVTKKYRWQYGFGELKTSADDGKMRVQLVFNNEAMPNGLDTKDLDCSELYPLIYSMHSFYLTRIIGIDPNFVKS